MAAVPDWMRPPRPEGWHSEDLDTLEQELRTTRPFEITLDLNGLVPGRTRR